MPRLHVGVQGVAIAEAAYQHALAYANERNQGYALPVGSEGANGSNVTKGAGKAMSPIVMHPDVARNLITMKSLIHAARAICYSCGPCFRFGYSSGQCR